MATWVRLCGIDEAPEEGKLAQVGAAGKAICLARLGGTLRALSNVCPHREAPLAEGWLEDGRLVCPWHSWAFDLETGRAEYPEGERVEVYRLRSEGGDLMMDIETPPPQP